MMKYNIINSNVNRYIKYMFSVDRYNKYMVSVNRYIIYIFII